jgi:hypothetical protein
MTRMWKRSRRRWSGLGGARRTGRAGRAGRAPPSPPHHYFLPASHLAFDYGGGGGRGTGEAVVVEPVVGGPVVGEPMVEAVAPNVGPFFGVSWCEIESRWLASITRVGGIIHRLGFFDVEMDAARCYDEAANWCRHDGIVRVLSRARHGHF